MYPSLPLCHVGYFSLFDSLLVGGFRYPDGFPSFSAPCWGMDQNWAQLKTGFFPNMTKTCGLFLLDVLLLYGAWLRGSVPREDSHMWVAYGGIIFPPKNRTMFLVELSHHAIVLSHWLGYFLGVPSMKTQGMRCSIFFETPITPIYTYLPNTSTILYYVVNSTINPCLREVVLN